MPTESLHNERVWHRNQRLRKLGYEDYAAYIASPEWDNVRRRYRRSTRPQCCGLCGTGDRLEIHHKTYERVGEERLSDLVALCGDCHRLFHTLERRGDLDGLDVEALGDSARAQQNRRRMRERFGSVEVGYNAERRAQRYRSVSKRLKDLLVNADRRGVDIDSEVDELEAVAERLNSRLQADC